MRASLLVNSPSLDKNRVHQLSHRSHLHPLFEQKPQPAKNNYMRPDVVRRTTTTRLPTLEGNFQLSHYVDTRDGKEHLALVAGQVQGQDNVLVRVHSECFTGDVLGSQRCDCGEQLHEAMRIIAEEGQGIVLYLRQEGRGIGLEQKLKAYNLQDQGYDTVDANLMLGHQADEREYAAAAAILIDLGINSIRILTNNPTKIDQLEQLGIQVKTRVALASTVTKDNAAYLATKIQRMRHLLTMPLYTNGNGHAHPAQMSPHSLDIDLQLALLRERVLSHSLQDAPPFVTLTYAQTLDGTIGSSNGERLHISGQESMRMTHALRAQHDAILVGIGTLIADDPSLTVRLVEGESPQPIIVDTHLRTPLHGNIWAHPKPPWIVTQNVESPAAHALRERGAKLIPVPLNPLGQLDLAALMTTLAGAGVRSLMVEGGAKIIASMVRQQLANYAVITVAPRLASGIRVNADTTADSSEYPQVTTSAIAAIQQPNYTQAGIDMIVWGEMHWSSPPTEFSLAALDVPKDFVVSPTSSSTL